MDEQAREQLADLAEDVITVMQSGDITGWLYVQDDNLTSPPCAMLVAETPDELLELVVTLFNEMDSIETQR
tara:strand:+ start:267 stop:479 length:213 start_codon:yes stop_codon:yes gene_type:complete